MKELERTVAVDLDGTILEFDWTKFRESGYHDFGKPRPGVVKALQKLRKLGYKIVIHSCRFTPGIYEGSSDTVEEVVGSTKKFLKEYGIIYDEFWTEKGKPVADFYIDDHAIRFTTWDEVMLYFE